MTISIRPPGQTVADRPPRRSVRRRIRAAAAGAAGLLVAAIPALGPALAQPVAAGASEWSVGERGQARLISTVTGVGDLETVRIGLEVMLEDGWKTYWRSPGDAGLPPAIDWTGSGNLQASELRYPAPERFTYYEFETFGYSDRVVYPIDLTPAAVGEPLNLKADLDLLICDDVCIPHEMALDLHLPAAPAEPSEFANLINRYAAQVPGNGENAGLAIEGAVLRGSATEPVLQVAFNAEQPFQSPDMLVEGPQFVVFSKPKVEFTPDGRRILATVNARDSFDEQRDLGLTSMPLTVTLLDGERSMEATITPRFGAPAPFDVGDFGAAGASGGLSFLAILALALLGGLILNLMPCVLPVLSIKLLSVVSHGGGDPARVRVGFLATTAGIIAAFLALALFLIALKAFGLAVGWGIQFQQPAFIITLVLILTLFAANMWGWFEIRLPSALSQKAVEGSQGTGLVGQFFQGVFATVLATPCSAPFLGTAVGFALSRGSLEIAAVFAALGAGMAIPFIAVAAVPKLATKLPKPGPWMLVLKKVLALALMATAVWLLTVLGVQVSVPAAIVVGVLMVLLLALFGGRTRMPSRWTRGVPAMAAAIAIVAFAAPSSLPSSDRAATTEVHAGITWVPFDRTAIASHVAAGKIVFVDVTAEWCITCQVNKRRVLYVGAVAAALGTDEVITMKADWTQPNEEIANYLASFNRFGIPFNVVYGPDAPRGITLPELLTTNGVLAAMRDAGASATIARTGNR